MLGSRKLLIFGIVFSLVLSLVFLGVSAEDRVLDEPMLRSLADPTYSFTVTSSVLQSLYSYLDDNGYNSSSSALEFSGLYNLSTNFVISGLFASNGQVYQISDGHDYSSAPSRVWGFDDFSILDFFVNEVGLSATLFNSSGQDFVLGGMLPLFGSITAIGSTLVSFVMSNAIVFVPIVAMVLVLGFGVIRRLIKGV